MQWIEIVDTAILEHSFTVSEMENNRHMPNLHDDDVLAGMQDTYVGLTTPPRVLTLDERPFPTLEVNDLMTEADESEAELVVYANGDVQCTPSPRKRG